MPTQIQDNVQITGTLSVSGGVTGTVRSGLTADTTQVYELPITGMRVWDAYHSLLSTGGVTDDMNIVTGAFANELPYLSSRDLNAAGSTTQYARTMFTLPPEYVASQAVQFRFAAGMITAVASVSATVDAQAYKSLRTTAKTGSDLVSTVAQSINSLTFAEKTFTVDSTGLAPGDVLDIRIALISNSATASSHFAAIAHAEIQLTIKG